MTNLQKYAKFLARIREFFANQNTLEVQTKSLLNYPTFDNNIDSIKVETNPKFEKNSYYLHTSPELEMKKILASGSADIYQICTVYRDNEIGQQNFNEFIMLEYYLLGIDELKLSENVIKLLNFVGICGEVVKFSYSEIFKKYANFDINSSFEKLRVFAKKHSLTTDFDSKADLQIMLFVHFVEKHLKDYDICVIYDFPQQQSALAKVEKGVAKRFEIYIKGVEIANGYNELISADEYQQRFLEQYGKDGKNPEFISAIKNSLPQCSGVAIGLGRVFSFL